MRFRLSLPFLTMALVALAAAAAAESPCVGQLSLLEACVTTGHFTSASAHHASDEAMVEVDFFTVSGFAGQITSLSAAATTGPAVTPGSGAAAHVSCNDDAGTSDPCDQRGVAVSVS